MHLSSFRSYDAIIGVTSNDWFHEQSAEILEKGIQQEEKDKFLRSYIINNYEAHLKEIFLSVSNEYTQWDQVNETILYSQSVRLLPQYCFPNKKLFHPNRAVDIIISLFEYLLGCRGHLNPH